MPVSAFAPTEDVGMGLLLAQGANEAAIEDFLGLEAGTLDALAADFNAETGENVNPTDGSAISIDDTGEFDEEAVAGCANDPTAMPVDQRIDQFLAMGVECCASRLVVGLYQSAIADYIGAQDPR